jgi:hypothetical protein
MKKALLAIFAAGLAAPSLAQQQPAPASTASTVGRGETDPTRVHGHEGLRYGDRN